MVDHVNPTAVNGTPATGFTAFIRRWGLRIVIGLAVVSVAIWYVSPKLSDGDFAWRVAVAVILFFLVFGIALMAAFFWLFRGIKVDDDKLNWIVTYCYAFIVFALSSAIVPFFALPLLPGMYAVMARSPVGIVMGCSVSPFIETVTGDPRGATAQTGDPNAVPKGGGETKPRIDERFVPKELRCDANTDQWVVNIGGAILHDLSDTKITPVRINGGLVVPLYAIVLALMGAAVSMTRRVPEYQRRLSPGCQDWMSHDQAREAMVFQIMQVVSAPLIALTVYYLVDPGSRASTIVLSFAAGFSSETILLVIRATLEKLRPDLPGPGAATAATVGVVPPNLFFGSVAVGQATAKTVIVSNPGPATLVISSLNCNGDYSALTQVPVSVTAHASTAIEVEFKPTAQGERQGQLFIGDNAVGSPRTVELTGAGA